MYCVFNKQLKKYIIKKIFEKRIQNKKKFEVSIGFKAIKI